jgi:hypothetical protein
VHDFVIHQAGYAYDGAIRSGSLVLLVDHDNKATELYDLATDLAQRHDRIREPGRANLVEKLRGQFLRYNDHNDRTREPRTTPVFRVSP